jgi:high-affinity nickel-transport protein
MAASPLTILLLGFFLGMRHALDPDHVIAVSTIVSRSRSVRRAAVVGLLWGIGHSLTIVVAGGAIVLFRLVLPPRAGMALELVVAAMLIFLGVVNLRALYRAQASHLAPHEHHHPPSQTLRPVVIGIVHGLAGTAAIALLVVPAIRDQLLAVAYLGVFGAGTILGMMLMTTALSAPIVYAGHRFATLQRRLAIAFSVASVLFGLFLGYRVGGGGVVPD